MIGSLLHMNKTLSFIPNSVMNKEKMVPSTHIKPGMSRDLPIIPAC